MPNANSWRFCFPSTIAPAPLSRATSVASALGRLSPRRVEPVVWGPPATANRSWLPTWTSVRSAPMPSRTCSVVTDQASYLASADADRAAHVLRAQGAHVAVFAGRAEGDLRGFVAQETQEHDGGAEARHQPDHA